MKAIIAGSRDFNNFKFLEDKLSSYEKDITEIVCGEARGADKLGRLYGETYCKKIKSFPAHWDKFGKGAGYIRNSAMAEYGDMLFAFWDGKSKGTQDMINRMVKLGKPTFVFYYLKDDDYE